MRRRDFITLLGSAAAAWPLGARAQPERMRRVGVLMGGDADDPEDLARLAGFKQGLERLGWSEGRNLQIDVRFAPGSAVQAVAEELIARQPDVVLATATGLVAALQRESGTIPIVFTQVSDPVGSGFVTNLARPGGNITGFLLFEAGIVGKWLSMLKEFAPGLARVAFVANPKTTAFDYFLRAAETIAPSLSIELVPGRIETAADIETAIESFARLPNGGLVLPADYSTKLHRDLVVTLAARHNLPAVYGNREFVAAGGLMAYDTDRPDIFRRAAVYVDSILRGSKPADLPVQAPIKYVTLINLKTAKALGLAVPPTLLVAADEIIE